MLKDDADTDFRCLTTVSCYTLSFDKIEAIIEKRQDMKSAFRKVEYENLKPKYPLALDYIFHNNNENDYESQLRKDQLKVKLKNAIMQTWSQIKKEKSPPSMNDLIDGILKKKRDSQGQGRDFKKEKQENEALQKKAE